MRSHNVEAKAWAFALVSFAAWLSPITAAANTIDGGTQRVRFSSPSSVNRGLAVYTVPRGLMTAQNVYKVKLASAEGTEVCPYGARLVFRGTRSREVVRNYNLGAEWLLVYTPAFVDDISVEMLSPTGGTQCAMHVSQASKADMLSPADHPLPLPPEGYSLVFNDEFNGSSLDRGKWFTRYIYKGAQLDTLNDEEQLYRDNENHVVSNGTLKLIAKPLPEPIGRFRFDSGLIRSAWVGKYGYFSARVRLPSARGVWAAMWLNSDVNGLGRIEWPPEIDVFEFVQDGVRELPTMLHSDVKSMPGNGEVFEWTDARFNQRHRFFSSPISLTGTWQIISCLWRENSVEVYLNGSKMYRKPYRWTYRDGTEAAPAHLILNLAVGGSWAGRGGVSLEDYPQVLEVDWVRIYQRESLRESGR